MDQSARNLDQLTASIRQRPSTNCADTHEPLAVDVGVVGFRSEEGAQVAFHTDGDKSEPLAAIALLAKHAEDFDDVGMVELTASQSFDVHPLRSWLSEQIADT
jgi:hypothetical protein